jgi:hypothetical protein
VKELNKEGEMNMEKGAKSELMEENKKKAKK